MYKKRFTIGLKKNPDPNPSKLLEKSISLTIHNQNHSENLNSISQNSAPNHNSLPNNSNLFKSFSQNSKTAPTLFIKPQLTIGKAREISQSQKSNSSQQSLSVKAKNNIKESVKTDDNFDKSQQKQHNSNQHEENSKIDLIPKTTEEESIRGKDKLKKFNTIEQNSGIHKEKLNIQVVSKHTKENTGKLLQKQNIAKFKVINKEQNNASEKVKNSKNVTSKRLQKTTNYTNEIVIKIQEKATPKISQNESACSKKSLKERENENQENKIRLSQVAVLSQPNKDLSHRERLEWLRDRRGVGTYIQCCNNDCSKWRYEPNIKDPVDVPEKWFCNMNSDDKLASCDAPEHPPSLTIEEDIIHNSYTAGSIVWARLRGYPWWPAMVDDDPDTEQYYWLDDFSDIPTDYHVVFFDSDKVSRSWIAKNDLAVFKTGKEYTRTKCGKKDYKDQIQIAKTQAFDALRFDIPERLYKYGFLARWEGPISTPPSSQSDNNGVDEEVDICDLNTLLELSRELSSHDNSLEVHTRKAVKKNRKRKTLNEYDEEDLDTLVESQGFSSCNDSFEIYVKKGLKKNQNRKFFYQNDENEKESDLDTTVKLSRDLNSNLTDSFDRNVNKEFKKNRKRKILDDDSSLELATNSKTSEVHKSLDETRAADTVITDSNDPAINNTTITNELFKDLIKNRENKIKSTDIFTDVMSVHSLNMFDSDDEHLPTQVLQNVN